MQIIESAVVAHISLHHSTSYDPLSVTIIRINPSSVDQARVAEIVASNHLAATILLENVIMPACQGRPIYA